METLASYKWPSKWPGEGGRLRLSRRLLLASAVAPLLPAQRAEVSSFDLSLLDERITPAELFFIRSHFPAPRVSAATWKLSVGGAVVNPLEIPYDRLDTFPAKSLPVTVECAENPVGGGLVSHAEWTGWPLSSLLDKAHVTREAGWVRLTGADGFSRCIPLSKAMQADTLVAFYMNGGKLPAAHGFPLRAVIPGWYGMDSVKWLERVEVLTAEDAPREYVREVRSLLTGKRPDGPVTGVQVKSAFSRPLDGAILSGRRFIVRGAAWAGENRVRQVEVSTDGAQSWQPARLDFDPQPYAWVFWSYDWSIKGAGPYELLARATDDQGRRQSAERAADRVDGYEWNTCQKVRVSVV